MPLILLPCGFLRVCIPSFRLQEKNIELRESELQGGEWNEMMAYSSPSSRTYLYMLLYRGLAGL